MAANSFLIWRGGTVRDFELKIEVRINGTNSGIQYRSKEVPAAGQWVLQGYQADIDFVNQYTGQHPRRTRAPLLPVTARQCRAGRGRRRQEARLARSTTLTTLKGYVNINGWNQYHIIARGSTLIHLLNGHLMAVFLDDDATNRLMEGVIGLQMHVGDPFKVEYRNIWLKQ